MPAETAPLPRLAVLDDYQHAADRYADWQPLAGRAEVTVFHDTPPDLAALVQRLLPFDMIATMRERTPFPAALVAQLPRLRFLATTGMRNRAFDLDALERRGIPVSGTESDYDSTTELTWALLLALARRVVQEHASLRAGGWQTGVGTNLRGRTLGLLGLGKIGAQVAAVGRLFGMRVIAWSENLAEARCAELGVHRVGKAALFAEADFLSVHMVLSERTRHLVGAADLARMRPSAYFINTSRGGLVDEAALVDCLQRGAIAGAALDVFEQEPLPAAHPLRGMDRVLLTPHVGYVTEDNYRIYFVQTVENVVAFLTAPPSARCCARVCREGAPASPAPAPGRPPSPRS